MEFYFAEVVIGYGSLMYWIFLLTCMANDRVEAAVSMICISKLLGTLHTTFNLISENHPPIITRSKYMLAGRGLPSNRSRLLGDIIRIY